MFSLVIKYNFRRVLLAITTFIDLVLVQIDVKTASLHGELEEEIHIAQPDGIIKKRSENMVCLLNKSLYALKQSLKQWHLRFDEFMITHKYFRIHYDFCVYFKTLLSRRGIYVLLYVDDMLISYKQIEEIEKLKNELSYTFEIKNIGSATRIWSMQIVRIKN